MYREICSQVPAQGQEVNDLERYVQLWVKNPVLVYLYVCVVSASSLLPRDRPRPVGRGPLLDT